MLYLLILDSTCNPRIETRVPLPEGVKVEQKAFLFNEHGKEQAIQLARGYRDHLVECYPVRSPHAHSQRIQELDPHFSLGMRQLFNIDNFKTSR